jgi:hypothetical protein
MADSRILNMHHISSIGLDKEYFNTEKPEFHAERPPRIRIESRVGQRGCFSGDALVAVGRVNDSLLRRVDDRSVRIMASRGK